MLSGKLSSWLSSNRLQRHTRYTQCSPGPASACAHADAMPPTIHAYTWPLQHHHAARLPLATAHYRYHPRPQHAGMHGATHTDCTCTALTPMTLLQTYPSMIPLMLGLHRAPTPDPAFDPLVPTPAYHHASTLPPCTLAARHTHADIHHCMLSAATIPTTHSPPAYPKPTLIHHPPTALGRGRGLSQRLLNYPLPRPSPNPLIWPPHTDTSTIML